MLYETLDSDGLDCFLSKIVVLLYVEHNFFSVCHPVCVCIDVKGSLQG